jgi:hypothetical protein
MKRRIWWTVAVVVVIGLVAVFYPRQATEPPPVPVGLPEPPPAPTPAEPQPEPPPRFVAAEPAEPAPPLPELDESDEELRTLIAEVAGTELVERYLAPDSLLRRFVATLDSLDGEAMWIEARVVPRFAGDFLVDGPEQRPVIASANYRRYQAFVGLIGALDTLEVANAYRRHYPLLQQAYEELGYPGRQFHNRVLEVIDHLLATPEPRYPLRLEQPHVLYRFADAQLEALSSGQKILLRVGPDNARVLRDKLIELRAALEDLSTNP